jgi:hypothetical protein
MSVIDLVLAYLSPVVLEEELQIKEVFRYLRWDGMYASANSIIHLARITKRDQRTFMDRRRGKKWID